MNSMQRDRSSEDNELYAIVEERLTAFFREMEYANWSVNDVACAIHRILKERWLDQAEALQKTSEHMPKNHVSDGNEG